MEYHKNKVLLENRIPLCNDGNSNVFRHSNMKQSRKFLIEFILLELELIKWHDINKAKRSGIFESRYSTVENF